MKGNSGYSIAEILVSLFIASLIIIFTANMFTGSLRSITENRTRTNELAKAQGIWETSQEAILSGGSAETSYTRTDYAVNVDGTSVRVYGQLVRMDFDWSGNFLVFVSDKK